MLGANDASGQHRFASKSTARGDRFTCVDCKLAVHPVRRDDYVPFFRHNSAGGCGGEGALHKAAVAVLASLQKLRVPRHPLIQPDHDDEVVEFRVGLQNCSPEVGHRRRPDIVVTAATGRFAIEVTVSNPLSDERRQWFIDHDLPCIELHVPETEATSEEMLADFMLARSDARDWVTRPAEQADDSEPSDLPGGLPVVGRSPSKVDRQSTLELTHSPRRQWHYRNLPPLSDRCDHDQPCSACIPNRPRSAQAEGSLERYRKAVRIAAHEGWTVERDLAIRIAAYACRLDGAWSDRADM